LIDLVALAYPEPTRHKRGGYSLETKELNSGTLSQARAIVKWCPEYVEDILAGIHVFAVKLSLSRSPVRPMIGIGACGDVT
jgi:hypothetical protein